jgi:hypothetical protein
MRGIRYVIFWTTMAVLAGQYAVAGAGPQNQGVPEDNGPGKPGIEQAGDIEHVANVPAPSAQRGSDIEFVTKTVVKLADGATGDPVCVADGTEPDGCAKDEAGQIVYQMEDRDFALLGTYGSGQIVDVTDPRSPVRVAFMPCTGSQNDIQIQGDLMFQGMYNASSTCKKADGTSQGQVTVGISNISNPRNPVFVGKITSSRGAHNNTVHPTAPLVYLSDSDLPSVTGVIPIWDFSNPAAPVKVTDFTYLTQSPHDITFNADGTRAYVASVAYTYILNTEDPRSPTLISTIYNEGISISHQSDPTPDGDYLLISDELGGGAAGLSPGGPVHVYDIRDETTPVKMGVIWDDCVGVSASCEGGAEAPISTAHVFRINPDGYSMAIGWYRDGVHVIDYSSIRGANPAGIGGVANIFPRTIGRMRMPGANTWAAKMWQERHPGYVFANDVRGLDVFYVSSMGPGFLGFGTITGAHGANYDSGVGVTRNEWETDCELSPVTNGVDGWVMPVPEGLGDGTHILTAQGQGQGFDLDLYFYDESCSLLSADEDGGTDESGDMPEGTKYAMVTNYLGPTQPVENPVHIRVTAS